MPDKIYCSSMFIVFNVSIKGLNDFNWFNDSRFFHPEKHYYYDEAVDVLNLNWSNYFIVKVKDLKDKHETQSQT